MNKPRCPRCGTPQHVVVGSGTYPDRVHYCQKCLGMFDDQPDEGGTHDDRDASRRLQREEENRARRKRA